MVTRREPLLTAPGATQGGPWAASGRSRSPGRPGVGGLELSAPPSDLREGTGTSGKTSGMGDVTSFEGASTRRGWAATEGPHVVLVAGMPTPLESLREFIWDKLAAHAEKQDVGGCGE